MKIVPIIIMHGQQMTFVQTLWNGADQYLSPKDTGAP